MSSEIRKIYIVEGSILPVGMSDDLYAPNEISWIAAVFLDSSLAEKYSQMAQDQAIVRVKMFLDSESRNSYEGKVFRGNITETTDIAFLAEEGNKAATDILVKDQIDPKMPKTVMVPSYVVKVYPVIDTGFSAYLSRIIEERNSRKL